MGQPRHGEFEGTEPAALERPAASPHVPAAAWEAMLDQMVEAAFFFDMSACLVTCNRAARQMVPWLRTGMTWTDFEGFQGLYPPRGGVRVPDREVPVMRALRGERVPMAEWRVQLRGKPPQALLIGASPVHVGGRQVGALTVAHDVTAQRATQDALRASEARLRSLVDNAPAIITMLDPDHRISLVSGGMSDAAPERYVGRPAEDFVAPGDRARYAAALDHVLRTGKPLRLELEAAGLSGVWGWYDVSLAPVVEDGRQVGLVGVCVDVTERKRAQAERDAQRHLLEQAEGLAGMGSWDMDLRTGKTRWSDGLYRILGYEPGAVAPGREAFVSRLRPQDAEAMRQAFARPGIEGPVALEIEVVRPDGEVRVVRLRGSVEYDEQELPARTVGIMKDVTEQLEIERMKHEFISTVSHELRTPLTAIRGPLSLLRRGWRTLPPEHTQEMLEMAVEGVDRMVRLVNDVLDVQRLATGRLSIAPEPADARELAQGAARDLAPRAAAADVRLRVRAPSTPLQADPARVNQVLCNLLDNALSFAPRGSTVDLEVRRLGPWVRFRVADRGPGIPADKLEVVFERFKQLDQTTKRRKGGTGLGLAISRELVGLMGGRIWAEHRRGGGTTFAFELPA